MYTIILADSTTVETSTIHLDSDAIRGKSKPTIVINAADKTEFMNVWDALSPSNLEVVEIYQGGARIGAYNNCDLENIQIVPNYDGSMTAYFYLIGEVTPATDPEYETAYKIIAGEVE